MEFLLDYGMFLAKVVTAVVAIMVVAGFIVATAHREKGRDKGRIQVTRLNERFEDMSHALRVEVVDEKTLKEEEKKQRKADKQARKAKKSGAASTRKPRVYVLDFVGDMKASATEELRESITAVLTLAEPVDEVVVRLESPGGVVHGYGLAASQLDRIRQKNIPLTVCVDKVAASGGYMMAVVGNHIQAAPFAFIGSIGVIAQLPNFHRWLKKHDVDYEQITAGEYKRTISVFGENTDEGRRKFKEELESIHRQFKTHVQRYRPNLDLNKVATGEYWTAQEAIEYGLVDSIGTSDAWLLARRESHDMFLVRYIQKKNLGERVGRHAVATLQALTNFMHKQP